MAMEKEDWNFEKMLIYQNKQGENKAIPKETTVLMLKEILLYIVKLAESEKESRDLWNGELSLCFDADAGE